MSSWEKAALEANMKELKDEVLESQIEFLGEELGDPGRYFPQLRSKGILDVSDCELIRSKVTLMEKIQALIGLVKGRQSNKGDHSFDILVDALKKQRVQAHIARGLQKALAKAKEDLSGNCNYCMMPCWICLRCCYVRDMSGTLTEFFVPKCS